MGRSSWFTRAQDVKAILDIVNGLHAGSNGEMQQQCRLEPERISVSPDHLAGPRVTVGTVVVLKAEGVLGGFKALSYFSVTPFIISTSLPFFTQREMAIKAKMPNYAWLSTIKDRAAAKFRDHLQLRGPFSAIAELSAVIRLSFGAFRKGRGKKNVK